MSLKIQPITERAILRHHFLQDPATYAYALGDLAPPMWDLCRFSGAFNGQVLEAIMLEWHGVIPPVLLLFGNESGAAQLLQHAPNQVFYMLPEQLLPRFQQVYVTPKNIDLWRMKVDRAAFCPVHNTTKHQIRQLKGDDIGALRQLYKHGGGGPRPEEIEAFSPEQIENGVFWGAFTADGTLAAVAGSHFYAPSQAIGGIGYVYTMPKQRNKGYGTALSSAVAAQMFENGIDTVILNVVRDNQPAIHAYQKLGFSIHAPFVEGRALRKNAVLHSSKIPVA